ncbi:MAG TPA: energy transducer TonB, partial [Polyangiaceae bacterium]
AVEPRLSAVFTLRKTLRLTHAFGVAQQPPSFIVPIPGLQISGLNQGLQRSLQSSASVEWDLPPDVTASGTLFQNAYFNLTDQLSNVNQPNSGDNIIPNQRSRGHTLGAELLIRRSFSQRVGGLLAYTLSKSWRTVDGERHAAAFDRRHVLQAALAFNLGRHWRSSIRTVVYSGVPSQAEQESYFGGNTASPSGGNVGPENAVNAANATARQDPDRLPRTPAFYRLDLRLQKRWPVGNRGAYWAMTFEMLNATLNREVVSQSCSSRSCRAERFGPVTVPSIGVEAVY